MAKQMATEWLAVKLFNAESYPSVWDKFIEQAKEMEKEQIIDAYKSDRYPCSDEDAEKYYNETYKTQNT
jgi:hypothetical protein